MKLSIITINLNNAEGLRQTIESVIPQLNDQCEYIIIDGDSTDGSLEIINEFDEKIAYWISEPNRGIYGDMNKGILKAKGEYCLFLNSGDWLNKNIIERTIRECTGEDIICFNTYLSYNNTKFEALKYSSSVTMRSFFNRTIGHQSTLIKTGLFSRFGMYNENNKIHSDYEFWIKSLIIGNCSYKYVDEFLSYYDTDGISSKPNEHTLKEMKSILTRHLPTRVLADYEDWFHKEREMETLMWYKRQGILYGFLVFIYKVVKNCRKLSKMKY
ncbi:glycosyltransferase [Runella sp. CRIBMP]|uniref:glycosyltransferase family 2 protein n=1 Tax=Runella sp. CRIBMP TaxID=2683261 RepID=UPI0021029140|nr:glycosyltransferase family 2 protein [Runella sp. CRIBMP]NBB22945.1 glycosyltransferase [Runella sp. CRIBMP]